MNMILVAAIATFCLLQTENTPVPQILLIRDPVLPTADCPLDFNRTASHGVSGHTMKERLLNELEDDYEPAVDPGVIDLKMSIYLLCSWVDSDTGFVRSNGWELYQWKDERLTWSPDEYGGLTMLRVPAKFVWTPDMKQFDSVTAEVDRDEDVNVVLYSDGNIIWIPRITYTSACSESEDKLNCAIRVGSWAYDGNNVRLQVAEESEGLALTYYKSACPLAVDNHTAEIVSHTYPCCEETYPSMDVNLVFSKRQ